MLTLATISRKKLFNLLGLILLAVLLCLAVVRTRARPQWQQKVDDWVLESGSAAEETEFLVVLREQADLGRVSSSDSKVAKGTAVYKQLTEVALRTQAPVVAGLEEAGAAYRPYWISNMIWVRGDTNLVEALARRPDVARIHANPWTKLDALTLPVAGRDAAAETSLDWNIELVKAPDVWGQGVTGIGAVVGGQDTGYDWQHPALKKQYRGWDGETASHAYNWYDAIHENNPNTVPDNPCGFDSPQPCDDQGHGTHTMGIMVGEDGLDNLIGMAPQAQWIGCRSMEQGWGTPATYAECYEWFVAPYPQDGDPFSDGDPLKAPHVINNSWSCPEREGCTDPDILRSVVDNVRAAGIVTVHSAANNGPNCGSLSVPAASYDASFSVGATDNSDQIAGFSSRGPSLQDGVLLTKPDISAPGVAIRSSTPGDSYGLKSGTSMAGPHVAGLVALLIETHPDLAGNVDQLEAIIQDTAVIQYSSDGCGKDEADSVPNNTYGWGRIDAYVAYEAAVDLSTPSPTPTSTSTATTTVTPGATGTPTPTATAGAPQEKVFAPLLFAP